jgi:hypothetical protein
VSMGESSLGPVWCESVSGESGLGKILVLVCVVLGAFLQEISVSSGVISVWVMSWFTLYGEELGVGKWFSGG